MICNKCGTEFEGNFCPGCGTPAQPQQSQTQQVPPVMPNQNSFIQPPKKKKHGCLTVILIVIGVILIIGIVGALASQGDSTDTASNSSETTNSEESKPTDETVEYTKYEVSELMTDLDTNAMKAEKKYTDQYVEITGKLFNIDSDGKYIDLGPSSDEFTIIGVQCYIKTDDQANQIMELSKGDTITLKGKITSVGEVMGYSLDIDEIE